MKDYKSRNGCFPIAAELCSLPPEYFVLWGDSDEDLAIPFSPGRGIGIFRDVPPVLGADKPLDLLHTLACEELQ